MRREVVALGAVVLVACAGCAPAPTPADPVQAEASSTEQVSIDTAPVATAGLGADYYVRTVKSLLSDVEHTPQPDADYIQGGRDICTQIDDGATWATFAGQIEEAGLDYDLHRAVVGAATISFCPQHAGIIG